MFSVKLFFLLHTHAVTLEDSMTIVTILLIEITAISLISRVYFAFKKRFIMFETNEI